jgi:hypothetical protein
MPAKKLQILVKQGDNHPDIDEENLEKETLGRLTDWIHNNHFTDNKLNDDCVNDVTVDIGQNKDWLISDFKEIRSTTIEGKNTSKRSQNNTTMIARITTTFKYLLKRMNQIIHSMPCRNNNKQLCLHRSTQLWYF